MSEPAFTIYPIPIAAYSTEVRRPFASIPAEDDAKAIADLLMPYGGVLHPWDDGRPDADWVKRELGAWADRDGPKSSVLVWVGHGESDTEDAWLASYNSTQRKKGSGHHAQELATHLADEWADRSDDHGAWTLVVIEACGAERFVQLLAGEVLSQTNPAGRFALLGGGGTGSGFLKAVPKALDEALQSFTANDEVIRVDDLVGRLENRLAFGLSIRVGLSQARPLTPPPRPLGAGVTATQDVYLELEAFLAGLPKDQRKFFVPKAQGAELGEPTWYFEGRGREHREVSDWLRTTDSGMLAVTGPAGSGKSAVLGNLVVHSNPSLRELLIRSDQVERLAAPEQPPDNAFDATVLLTGLTTTEVINRLVADLQGEPDISTTLDGLRTAVEDRTVMVDALDEAQAPMEVAAVLRQLSEVPGCRVVVGTRRSTNEGLDLVDPVDTNLLDALQPTATLTVDLDSEAVTRYVEHRLTAQQIDPGTAAAAARSVGAHNRHFLYARLAVHEILARPDLLTAAAQPELAELLAQDSRGLFATAVDRLTVADRNFRPLLEALAHARGRGLPRADGTWATAAGAFMESPPGESDLDRLLVAAAPYVMLDGEHGQSTYRLAHQTFVEHFHSQPSYAAGHRRIARALATRQLAATDGWADANFYTVRYLAEHLVADADRIAPASAAVADLVTDAGWLTRAIDLLGVDQTDAVITAAKIVIVQNTSHDDAMAVTMFQTIDVMERALRRSRTALTRDPIQLAGQLHARLKGYSGDASMSELGDAVGRLSTTPWLRMVEGSLDWKADLESTYSTTGKVRGLGFGQVDDLPVVAIAVDERIELWDPRTGIPDVMSMIALDHRATAVAMSVIDGRPVVVTSAGYDRILEVWDARTKERIAAADVGFGHAIGVGRVDGRLVIAGVDIDRTMRMVDAVTLQPFGLPPALEAFDVRGFGIEGDGALVLLAVQDEPAPDRAHRILLINPTDGRETRRTDPIQFDSGSLLDVMAGALIGASFVVVAGIGKHLYWFFEGHAHFEKSPYAERARAIAVGMVGGQPIVAAAPDYDDTALVRLQQFSDDTYLHGVTLAQIRSATTARWRSERSVRTPVPKELGNEPEGRQEGFSQDGSRPRSLELDRPEDWPQSVAAAGEVDGVPVIATGSVDGAVWVWDGRTLAPTRREGERPRAIAGPFVELPSYVLEQGWDLLHAKPSLEQATSVALGNVPGYGAIVAVACGGEARMYTIADGKRIENPADRASAVQCVAIGTLNARTVLVTGSTGGNVAVWDPAAGSRIAGLYVDDPITNLAVDSDRILLQTATHGDYYLELKEP